MDNYFESDFGIMRILVFFPDLRREVKKLDPILERIIELGIAIW